MAATLINIYVKDYNHIKKCNIMKRELVYLCSLLFLCTHLSCQQNQRTDKFAPLFPFVISYDGPDNVTNMSHLLDAPAGKYGFIRAENGHFVNDFGRVWLNGTNLTGSANFPSHDQANRLAERLARFGINCVRLHYMDANYGNFLQQAEQGIFTKDTTTQRNLDSIQMDKLDYMIAQFKKKGIYVNINLHVARKMDERDGFTGVDHRPHLDKGVDNFYPRMIELQKEYARDLLTHINPYTNLAYTDDPCVAMVEINNENALFSQYFAGSIDKLPAPYILELQKQWNEWIHSMYKTVDELAHAWSMSKEELEKNFNERTIPTVATNSDYSKMRRDFYKFIYDVENKYWTGMYNYLKNDLGVKSVISGTQLRYSSPFIQAKLDYVDIHNYWRHPGPINHNWEIDNISMVNSLSNMYEMAGQRVEGKPYTISEYNHPFPNQYGAEGQPMLRAYGRLQDWDGVFQYSYNNRSNFEPDVMTYFFDMIARTDVLAHMPACATIYLRGDVQTAKESIVAKINHTAYFDSLAILKRARIGIEAAGFDPRLSLVHKTSVELTENPVEPIKSESEIIDNQKIITSDTEELTWNMEKAGAGYWTVNTNNTKLFTGFPDARTVDLGSIKLKIGDTRLGWATVSFVSQNATGFGESGNPANILLAATGLMENKGMAIQKTSQTKIKLTDWGDGPIYVEGIPAKITLLSSAQKTKCYSLDNVGNRKKEVPVVKVNENTSEIVIDPKYKTVWYEIEIK